MSGLWTTLALGEQAATAGAGAANALYFIRRAVAERGPRRVAAALLGGLFAGSAGHAATHAWRGSAEAGVVLADAPVLLANVGVLALVMAGWRR